MLARGSKFLLGLAGVVSLACGTAGAMGEAPCLEAVFFDLGNTLVENPGNGIFVLRAGAAETISGLQDLGVRLGIITNVPAGWDLDDLRAILEEPEFLDEFEVVILSSQAPAPKPNPAIYTFAHGALAAPRPPITSTAFVGETISEIGNHATNPTQGARAVGMVGIHLSDSAPSPFTDFTIPSDSLHFVISIVEETCAATGVSDPPAEPGSRLLYPPHPNPSNGDTRIEFSVPGRERVEIQIFDGQGRRVASLVDRVFSAGRHQVVWDGRDADGEPVPNGVYYSRMQAGDELQRVKILKFR